MSAVVVSRELFFATRLRDLAARSGVELVRVDDPDGLPPPGTARLVLVDWDERGEGWGGRLSAWRDAAPRDRRARIVLFGPHADRAAHADARSAGLGPMWARSKLLVSFESLLGQAGQGD